MLRTLTLVAGNLQTNRGCGIEVPGFFEGFPLSKDTLSPSFPLSTFLPASLKRYTVLFCETVCGCLWVPQENAQ